jgi:hypothetical protein
VEALMDNLVVCPCGHNLSMHDFTGCAGERLRRCPCERDRHAALEAAVDSVRTTPAYNPAYSSRSNDAA